MQSIYNRTMMEQTLAGELDPVLRCLLETCFAALETPWGDLTEDTEWVIIEIGDSEDAIERAIGFSPLVEPIDGARFGSEGFYPCWNHLADHGGWFEMTVSFGSSFAYVLVIQDAEGVLPELRAMCRQNLS